MNQIVINLSVHLRGSKNFCICRHERREDTTTCIEKTMAKKSTRCATIVEDGVKTCPNCASANFTSVPDNRKTVIIITAVVASLLIVGIAAAGLIFLKKETNESIDPSITLEDTSYESTQGTIASATVSEIADTVNTNTVYAMQLRDILNNPSHYSNIDYDSDGEISFAITDINDDGKNELLVKFELEPDDSNHRIDIWKVTDSGDLTKYGETRAYAEFYKGGFLRYETPYNRTSGPLFPINIDKYNECTKSNDWLLTLYSSEDETTGEITYYCNQADKDEPIKVPQSEFYDIANKYAPEKNKINFAWLELSEKNIKSFTGC